MTYFSIALVINLDILSKQLVLGWPSGTNNSIPKSWHELVLHHYQTVKQEFLLSRYCCKNFKDLPLFRRLQVVHLNLSLAVQK